MLSETMHTLWMETSSYNSLRSVRTAFSLDWKNEHHLLAGIVPRWWVLGSLGGPLVTMMPLPPFPLPCVATPSV